MNSGQLYLPRVLGRWWVQRRAARRTAATDIAAAGSAPPLPRFLGFLFINIIIFLDFYFYMCYLYIKIQISAYHLGQTG